MTNSQILNVFVLFHAFILLFPDVSLSPNTQTCNFHKHIFAYDPSQATITLDVYVFKSDKMPDRTKQIRSKWSNMVKYGQNWSNVISELYG